jgi:hypothetical protein
MSFREAKGGAVVLRFGPHDSSAPHASMVWLGLSDGEALLADKR